MSNTIDQLRLSKSALTDTIYVGIPKGSEWMEKKDITNDFIKAVIDRFAGFKETVKDSEGNTYQITVKKL